MGNTESTPALDFRKQSGLDSCFKIERILANNPNVAGEIEPTIRIGILSNPTQPENPLGHQAIKIGTSEPYRLKAFQEGTDSLTYCFEKDVKLNVVKRKNSFVYNLETPTVNVTAEVYPGIHKMFKPLAFGDLSTEFDKLDRLFKQG